MGASTASQMTPRDLSALADLKSRGLSLLEVKISQISPALGKLLCTIALPEKARVVCLNKGGELFLNNLEAQVLGLGDSVYVLTDDETLVRALFTL